MELFLLPSLLISSAFLNVQMRFITSLVCLVSLISWKEVIYKIKNYEIFIIIYPIFTLISTFLWSGTIFEHQDLSQIQYILPVIKIPFIYFGTKCLMSRFKINNIKLIPYIIKISAIVILVFTFFRVNNNLYAVNNIVFGSGLTNYPTNPYYDVICIFFAASLFCISSLKNSIGQKNTFFYFIGICTLISGVLTTILFSTRFSVFALLLSSISTVFVFRRLILKKLKEIKNNFLISGRFKIPNLFILAFLIVFGVFILKYTYNFFDNESLAKGIFLYKFFPEPGYIDTSYSHRIGLYTNFLRIDILKQISLLFVGIGAGSFPSMFNHNTHSLINEILFNAGLPVVISYLYFIFYCLKKTTSILFPSNLTTFFFLTFIISCTLTHDFGRSSIIWICISIYTNTTDGLSLKKKFKSE